MKNLELKAEEYVKEKCSQCNSDVNIPKEIKQWLDKIESSELSKKRELITQMFASTKKYSGQQFYISELTANLYCNFHCYHLYCED